MYILSSVATTSGVPASKQWSWFMAKQLVLINCPAKYSAFTRHYYWFLRISMYAASVVPFWKLALVLAEYRVCLLLGPWGRIKGRKGNMTWDAGFLSVPTLQKPVVSQNPAHVHLPSPYKGTK